MGTGNGTETRTGPFRDLWAALCLPLAMLILLGAPQGARGQAEQPAGEEIPQKRPNIIVFLSDDHGAADAGCYGNPDVKTPVIDQLAREGMRFTRAYTPVAVCSPSRSALFTGLYPHRNGCHQNHGEIKSSVKTLPEYLEPLGYKLVLAGKTHIAPQDAFDFTYIDRDQVPGFLRDIGEKPFCLIIAFSNPHQPYFNHKSGYKNVSAKSWLPETGETQKYIAAYYDHVTLLDHELGAMLYWIEKYEFTDAFQLYTSDHGPAFPFAKWSLYEQGIRVPFIVKWKGKVKGGTTTRSMVSLVDLLPTLVQVAGGPAAGDLKSLDGKSMVPLLFPRDATSNASVLHEYIYAAYTNKGIAGASEYPIRAIRDESFKLIINVKHENTFKIKRMDTHDERARIDSYSVLSSWMRTAEGKGPVDSSAYQRARQHYHRPKAELYHLKEDPWELKNLAGDPEYSLIKARLFQELSRWMTSQGDPLAEEMKKLM